MIPPELMNQFGAAFGRAGPMCPASVLFLQAYHLLLIGTIVTQMDF